MSSAFVERRMHQRDPLNVPVEISHDGKFLKGNVTNLSLSGAQIHSTLSFETGCFVEVEFKAPRASQVFFRAANVVWNEKSRMGIRFIPEDRTPEMRA